MHLTRLHKGGVKLNTTIIAVGSVTYAIKAKKLLERIGVKAVLVKVDTSKNNGSR